MYFVLIIEREREREIMMAFLRRKGLEKARRIWISRNWSGDMGKDQVEEAT